MASAPLQVPRRVLLGPGPSDVAPSVLSALAEPTLGHLDPFVLGVMDDLAGMLREMYRTQNEWTLATSGTGTSGMEACLANLVRPGDHVLVCVHGYFGLRLVDIARRCGAEVTQVDGEWGCPSDPSQVRAAAGGRGYKLLCAVHAETSTGVLQDMTGLREVADEVGALLLVDAVTSLGCVPLELDAWGVDAAYSCSQKGLSCTPGLAPVSFSARAVESIRSRSDSSGTFYLDAGLLMDYWGGPRGYHHTASSNLYCALREAARLALEEGLEARWERHRRMGAALAVGLETMGLELAVAAEHRLPQLTVVRIPEGIDDARVRARLLERHRIEIGGGLGAFKGRVWRIGLMGHGASERNLTLALTALGEVLGDLGFQARDDGVAAARERLAALD